MDTKLYNDIYYRKMRYDWADFVRGFLMVLVFIYHSEVYYGHEHTYSWVFVPFFLTGFFFVSGYLFTRDIKAVSIKAKIKQVIRGLVFPYIVFEAILGAPKVIAGRTEPMQFMSDMLLFRGLWFIIAIGVMQILYALVLSKKPTLKALALSTLVYFAAGLALCSIYYPSSPIYDVVTNNHVLYSPDLPNRLPFCLNLALLNCPFFALGIMCRYYDRFFIKLCERRYLFISTLLYVALYCVVDHFYIGSWWVGASGTYSNLPLMMIYALIGIWMICCFSCLIRSIKPINYIGKYSILFLFLNGGGLLLYQW